ncbi:pheophytinase, chloroplastic isoform X2 [Asparagus officinalis]|uniref:pheophytinase, chloroplastic isoform X2 n=1 Tax=Asparagus officinalis TaxID=4686 RepID=UPI00098E5F73|nr:pheophytinase, chloroplastic isoform X2 [Asparagus officinalis]
MESLSSHSSIPSFSSLTWKFVGSSPDIKNSNLFIHRRSGILFSGTKLSCSLRISNQNSDTTKNLYQKEGLKLLGFLQGIRNLSTPKAADNCHYHATDGSVGLRTIPQKSDEVSKIWIPGLPNESDGSNGSPINSGFWEWKPNLTVHYEKSGVKKVGAPNVLFLPGFGVGTFHYEKQLKDLGREYKVWTLDFLGQGMSLPSEDPTPLNMQRSSSEDREMVWGFGDESQPWANELAYSIDLWQEQVQDFVEQVIGEPVYVVGNSLGGYVALYFAACKPELVKGVTLLNATPFWGFLPNPIRSPRLAKIFPWAGTFPLPSNVKKLTQLVWHKISDPSSIEEILRQVYADHSTKVDKVFSRIIETTQHPAAAASFASIMFSPKGELSFQEALNRCQLQNIPICLMYGKEDPWVRPVWGMKVKQQFPEAPYYEISPAGHCPHDEVPEKLQQEKDAR